jgi:hypothetical protein
MISIPKPCHENWDAMVPTAAGRHCASCQTEVVDFTRMNEAEVLAFMASRRGQRICAFMAAPAAPSFRFSFKRVQGPRRWLLAAMALLSGQPLAAAERPPQPLPVSLLIAQNPTQAIITIRGVVLDNSLNVPVGGARVYIGNTQYGVIANERGEFSVSFPTNWEPAKSGSVTLRIGRQAFALLEKTVVVSVKESFSPAPLIIRQLSEPDRWLFIKGKAVMEGSPIPVPGSLFPQAAKAITIRGVVLEDSLNVPVPKAQVFINGTKYGTVTNEQGEFELTFARDWKVVEKQQLVLAVSAGHFVFKPQHIPLDINRPPTELVVVRLIPTPGLMGKIARTKPPVRPPRPRRSHQ